MHRQHHPKDCLLPLLVPLSLPTIRCRILALCKVPQQPRIDYGGSVEITAMGNGDEPESMEVAVGRVEREGVLIMSDSI